MTRARQNGAHSITIMGQRSTFTKSMHPAMDPKKIHLIPLQVKAVLQKYALIKVYIAVIPNRGLLE
jgi:hypothetical protein